MDFSLVTIFACTFLVGGMSALWKVVPAVVSQRLGLPESRLHSWRIWHSLTLAVLFPWLGQLVDSWEGGHVLFAGILATALGLALLGLSHEPLGGLLAILLLALAFVLTTVATVVGLPKTFAHLGLEKSVAAINLGFVGVALGSLLTPALVNFFLGQFGYRQGFLLLGLACLVPAALVKLTPADRFHPVHPHAKSLAEFAPDVRWWLLGFLSLLYFPLENQLGSWKGRFLQQATPSPRLASFGFWFSLLGMRLAIGWIIWDQYEAWGLVCLAIAYAIIVGNLASSFAPGSGTLGLWLVGGSVGPMLPTLLACLLAQYPNNQATLVGIVFGAGALGNLLFEPLLQRFAHKNSLQGTMRLSMLFMLIWGAAALVLALLPLLG